MNYDPTIRTPRDTELSLLQLLLEREFPGSVELRNMLSGLKVRTLDEEGSIQLIPNESFAPAPVVKQIPVEAEALDKDGVPIHVLLRVADGRFNELEIYKDDGSTIVDMPDAHEFTPMVLPPIPE